MRATRASVLWASTISTMLMGVVLAGPVRAQAGSPPTGASPKEGSAGALRFLVPGADSSAPAQIADPKQLPALQRTIALDLHGATRDRAIAEIGRASGLGVVYASELIPRSGSIDLSGTAIPVEQALETALAGLGLDALLGANGTVVLTARAAPDASLRVQVLDTNSRIPLEDALLALVNADGAAVVQGLTNRDGVGVLTVPTGGRYRVRVRRMGYSPFTSRPITLLIGDTVRFVFAVPSMAVTLPEVKAATTTKTCRHSDAGRIESLALWEQVQTALETSELTSSDTSVHTFRHSFTRLVSPSGTIDELTSASQLLGREQPFVARSPADLSFQGYVTTDTSGEPTFAAPDAEALLSSQFESEHCFGLVQGSGATAGLVGLSFTPVVDRVVPDIQGVMWVAQKNPRLEYIEYRYVNHDWPGLDGVGGRVIFERLPTGRSIVHDWFIRAPRPDGGNADVGWSAEALTTGPAPSAPSPVAATAGDGPAPMAQTCPDSTFPFTVWVTDTIADRGLAGAMVEVNRFARVAAVELRTTEAPQVAATDSTGTASLCVRRGSGELGVVAYVSRAISAVALLPVDSAPSDTVELDIDGRELRHAVDSDERTSRLDMVVLDSRGKPLEGATAEVTGQLASGLTNGAGQLSVRELKRGTAIVDVWRPGYVRQRLVIDLPPEGTQTIEVRLAAEGTRPAGKG